MNDSTLSGAAFLTRATDPRDVVTPDDLGEEERMMVRSIIEFVERDVAPEKAKLQTRDRATCRRLFKRAAELGIFMAEVPEELGGLDLSVLAITAMCSPPSEFGGAMGQMIYGHQGIGMLPIVNFGSPAQISKYLGPCMQGDMLSAFALTEPSSGSDAMNIRTKAVLDPAGTHYVLNGAKQWITNAGLADLFVLFAKVDGERFTAFLVERATPGLSVGEPERLLGHDGSFVNALSLENVRVPVDNVLGEVGSGHKVAFCTLNMGRLKLAASSATASKGALRVAAVYAASRIQFGRPIADFGVIKRKIADMAARSYAAESTAYRTAGLVYHALEALKTGGRVTGEQRLEALAEFSAECALAKVYSSEAYNGGADEALQVFGGYGFSEEYPPAKMYRDSRITRIYEGTNEINRLYAQRTILKRWAGGVKPPDSGEQKGELAAVAAMKTVYFELVGETVERVGVDGLQEPARQQFLVSLADIAMEIYAAESTALRVAKHGGDNADAEAGVRGAISALVTERSLERIHTEARTVIAELRTGTALTERLARLAARLPPPRALVEVRTLVADWVVARGGRLPGESE